MKKTLKTLLIVAVVLLLSLISFVGIYTKKEFKYEDQIPEYTFASNLNKVTVANLKPDETENSEEALTIENYRKSKEIIEKRLKNIGLPEYKVRANENTGNIQIEFQEHDNVYAGSVYASYLGKIEIVDNQTDEVVMTNDDLKKVTVGYDPVSATSSSYQVYLNVELNKQGQEKMQNILNNSQNEVVEQENEKTAENSTENIIENTTESTQTADEEKTKGLTFKFEDEEISTVEISKISSKKSFKVNIESATSSSTQINSYLNQGATIALISDSGKMPIKYTLEDSKEVNSQITNKQISIAIYVLVGILAIASLYMIIKYKKNGLLMTISNIGAVAILMILVRYTNVLISYEAISAFAILVVAIILISLKILNKLKDASNIDDVRQRFNAACIECIDIIVVLLAIAIVFTFINWTGVASIGMIMFWGIISAVITRRYICKNITNRKHKKIGGI